MKTPNTPTDSELAKQLANSLLRDFFAAATLAGRYAAYHTQRGGDYPSPKLTADWAFTQADRMMEFSHTPKIIEQIKNL